jgi:hypothetical protein
MSAKNQTNTANQPLNLGGFFDSFVRQISGVINGR